MAAESSSDRPAKQPARPSAPIAPSQVAAQPGHAALLTAGAKISRFRVKRPFDDGSGLPVFVVQDEKTQELLLLTAFPDAAPVDKTVGQELKESYQRLQAFRHPGVSQIGEVGLLPSGGLYVVSRSGKFAPLLTYLQNPQAAGGTEPAGAEQRLAQLVDLLRPIAETIDLAHQAGVVHGALQPCRIVVDSRGATRLQGFNPLSSVSKSAVRDASVLSPRRWPYVAPEQWLDKPCVPQTDQFALGAIIYEGLNGRAPFGGASIDAVRTEALAGVVPRLVGFSSQVNHVLARALAERPEDRFASCQEFIRHLGECQGDCATLGNLAYFGNAVHLAAR